MASYLFSLDDIDSLKPCVKDGVYSTNLSSPEKNKYGLYKWKAHHEGAFTDYFSMKEGDNIYFFIDRNIYSVGESVNIKLDCKFNNYPNALNPNIPKFSNIKSSMLISKDKDTNFVHFQTIS